MKSKGYSSSALIILFQGSLPRISNTTLSAISPTHGMMFVFSALGCELHEDRITSIPFCTPTHNWGM
jgi:hypothetical protein